MPPPTSQNTTAAAVATHAPPPPPPPNKWGPYASAKDFDASMVTVLVVLVCATAAAFALHAAFRLLLRRLRSLRPPRLPSSASPEDGPGKPLAEAPRVAQLPGAVVFSAGSTRVAGAPECALCQLASMVTVLVVLVCATAAAFALHAAFRLLLRRLRSLRPPRLPSSASPEDGPGKPLAEAPRVAQLPGAVVFSAGSTRVAGAPECAICLAELAEGDRVRVLPVCSHGFHAMCVEAWLAGRSSCPTCRTDCLPPPLPAAATAEP